MAARLYRCCRGGSKSAAFIPWPHVAFGSRGISLICGEPAGLDPGSWQPPTGAGATEGEVWEGQG